MRERHGLRRSGWLRAAVLGANDGIVSTASLVIGVAAAGADRSAVLTAGIAGLVAESARARQPDLAAFSHGCRSSRQRLRCCRRCLVSAL